MAKVRYLYEVDGAAPETIVIVSGDFIKENRAIVDEQGQDGLIAMPDYEYRLRILLRALKRLGKVAPDVEAETWFDTVVDFEPRPVAEKDAEGEEAATPAE